METKEILKEEQPNLNNSHPVNTEETIGEQQNLNEGSSLNKFKSVQDLKEAYESLQAEFTRKCQELSNLKKDTEEEKEKVLQEIATPEYSKQDWQKKVGEFISKNPDAKKYTSEISDLIASDKDIATSNNSLDLAWTKILASNYKSPEKLAEEEGFLNTYIYENPKVQSTIIQNYLKNLNEQKQAPVISSHTGSSFTLTQKAKPNSLEEAGEMARALFKIN